MHADIAGVDRLSGVVIGCAFQVMNGLGAGFAEKVYENALAFELRKVGLKILQQQAIAVHYDGIVVGECAADLLVENTIRFPGDIGSSPGHRHLIAPIITIKLAFGGLRRPA